MIISDLLCCFTNGVVDELTKYKYGWSMITIIILNVVVNISIFLKKIFRILYLIALKYYRRLKSKIAGR